MTESTSPWIVPSKFSVAREARSERKGHRPFCVWFTGLSGAGKSTLANLLEEELHGRGMHTYQLDGDNVRTGLCRDLGMGLDDRRENVRRLGEVARLFVDAGLVVLVSAISPLREDRQAVRERFAPGEFFEIHVSTSFEECQRRDVKGLYRAALEGRLRDFTGVDSPYEEPLTPELRIDTGVVGPEQAVRQLLAMLSL
ncbi:adenylyl-sulfate kinase [Pseudomonas schmalbachii]|uniref:Adenylyl-sulfate kinase n=1 Tax=Pseudomonas schmalbachii TaxID=2816993 RepID=A0ABS3TX15_9PSED|nr:adenylyl-sulfate kinase [Pseudomonas schmalbachii]MBO3278225.1 adenylyl-sulfate kinase [Pseudomonas schmalbachii]